MRICDLFGALLLLAGAGTSLALEPPPGKPPVRNYLMDEYQGHLNNWVVRQGPDQRIYVGGGDGLLYALDATDGTEQWSRELRYLGGPTPAVADETVYFKLSGEVWAVDAADGTDRWTFDLDRGVLRSGISELAVLDDTVYAGTGHGVYALAASDGTERWFFETDVGSPLAVTTNAVYVGDMEGTVYALDPRNGTEHWRFETGDRWVWSTVVVDETLYIGTSNGTVYALTEQ